MLTLLDTHQILHSPIQVTKIPRFKGKFLHVFSPFFVGKKCRNIWHIFGAESAWSYTLNTNTIFCRAEKVKLTNCWISIFVDWHLCIPLLPKEDFWFEPSIPSSQFSVILNELLKYFELIRRILSQTLSWMNKIKLGDTIPWNSTTLS